MPYVTALPGGLIDLNLELPVLNLGQNLILNNLPSSNGFQLYDLGPGNDGTAESGDPISLVGENGQSVFSGTYAGEASIRNAGLELNLGLASVSIALNPINGHLVADNEGKAFFMSDNPLDQDHLGVTITVSSVLTGPITIEANISALEDTLTSVPLLGPLLGTITDPILNGVQDILDTAIISIDHDPTGTFTPSPDLVICFAAGTLIETKMGLVPVENLSVGDLVATKDHGYQPIKWIGSAYVPCETLGSKPHLRPIRIRAGALGENTPFTDLLVSPQHRILVRSRIAQRMFGAMEVLVPAKQLLQLDGIDYAEDVSEVHYYHILFDKHEIVIANGAESESLFTGPQALGAIGPKGQKELMELFPELFEDSFVPEPASMIISGRQARKLATRHIQSKRRLVC